MGGSRQISEDAMKVMLSPVEITYLARLLGAEMVIGIGDPFYAWLSKDIEEAWGQASSALQERDYLKFKGGGGPILDVGVAAAMVGFTNPTATLFAVGKGRNADEDTRVFHLTSVYGVEQTGNGELWDELTLTLHEDLNKTLEKVLSISELAAAPEETSSSSTNITMDLLWKLMSAADAGDERMIQEALGKEEITEGLDALSKTIMPSYWYYGLLGVKLVEDSWHLSGLTLLWNNTELWAGVPDFSRDTLPIRFHTASREEAMHSVEKLFWELIPIESRK